MKVQSRLYIDQGQITLHRLFRYISQGSFFTTLDFYAAHHTTMVAASRFVIMLIDPFRMKSSLNGYDLRLKLLEKNVGLVE